MFSRSSFIYAAVFFVTGSLFGASVFAVIAPTAEIELARPEAQTGVPVDPTIAPWSDYLSKDAVDAAGIESDLDGNAAALVAR